MAGPGIGGKPSRTSEVNVLRESSVNSGDLLLHHGDLGAVGVQTILHLVKAASDLVAKVLRVRVRHLRVDVPGAVLHLTHIPAQPALLQDSSAKNSHLRNEGGPNLRGHEAPTQAPPCTRDQDVCGSTSNDADTPAPVAVAVAGTTRTVTVAVGGITDGQRNVTVEPEPVMTPAGPAVCVHVQVVGVGELGARLAVSVTNDPGSANVAERDTVPTAGVDVPVAADL